MKSNIQTSIEPVVGGGNGFGWILLLLQLLTVPFAMWGFFALLQDRNSDSAEFIAMTVLLVSAATAYIALRGLRRVAWTSLPVLLTIEMMIGFVIMPVTRFATGVELLDSDYARAMFLALIAFVAFAIGSLMLLNETGFRFVPRLLHTSDRISFISAAMFALGMLGNIVLWKLGLFGYTADELTREQSNGFIQWVNFLANLLAATLVVSAIEVIGKRSSNPLIKIVFWLSFLVSVGLGLIAGLKSEAVYPLLDVLLVIGITRNRMPRTALLLPVFFLLIYPFINAYRENLNGGYRGQVNTVGGLETVLVKSFGDAYLSLGSESIEAGRNSTDLASGRLSYLGALRDLIEVPDFSMLNGDEKVWLAPVYPLVPRFLWKNKPIIGKGGRLSEALGRGVHTASAITPIGDLYAMYGIYGVAIGMFVWGAILQLYMNWIGNRDGSERNLFIYILMVPILMNLENDVVGEIGGVIHTGLVIVLISYVIYGPQASSSTVLLGRPRPYGTQ